MSTLFHHGILGLNARNLLYIKPFNPRKAIAFADDKLKTKAYLAARGIPVAKIYARIETRRQLRAFDTAILPDECVLKPNAGFGGEGILILKGRKNGVFLEQGKTPISARTLHEHLEDILDGRFSINGRPDIAFFEKILTPHTCFVPFRPAGLPDIRIIVFNMIPIMAMLRIPTKESKGKANVHLGGIGIGIDIASGTTTFATRWNRRLLTLPSGSTPSGFTIPFWENLLLIASRIQELTNIGYLAVDLTIDTEQGPALLEVNARAGLMVQVANLAPLQSRLDRVKGVRVSSPEQGVRMGKDLFGKSESPRKKRGEAAQKIIVGLREILTVPTESGGIEAPCMIETQQEYTLFAPNLIEELMKLSAIEREDTPPGTYRVKFILAGKKIRTIVHQGAMPQTSIRAIIGQRDLRGLLIDPLKHAPPTLLRQKTTENLLATDRALTKWDRNLLLLRELKPINLLEERRSLEKDLARNPLFLFPPLSPDIQKWEELIRKLTLDDSPLGNLLRKKQQEMLARISLLRSRGKARSFTEASKTLFGEPTTPLILAARASLDSRVACDLPRPENSLTTEETREHFAKALEKYGMDDWKIIVRPTLIGDCTIGKHRLYLRRGARFSLEHIHTLIIHEIETHGITAENGEHQPFRLFRIGFANYLDTQEGLAVFNQNRILSPYSAKRYGPARTALALHFALTHSFAETRKYLGEALHYPPEKALIKTLQLKRGIGNTEEPGAFTKGIVYFRGLRAMESFVQSGGDLRRLYIGKIALEDLEIAERLPGITPPVLLPDFLRDLPPQN